MTNHRYPATLAPARVAEIDDIAKRVRDELTQAHVAATAWQQQAEQLSASIERLRAERDSLQRQMAEAHEAMAAKEDRAQALERDNARLFAALRLASEDVDAANSQ